MTTFPHHTDTDTDTERASHAPRPTGLTIYACQPGDAIRRLAALDSARCPTGRVLVAAVDGRPLAAVPLAGGRAIADPFARTAELVDLLHLRAAQLRAARRPRPARVRSALWRMAGLPRPQPTA